MKTVGIGVIGTGFARRVQLPAFAACEDTRIVSVASGSFENARSTADEFSASHYTNDWRETCSHPDVDLVCITTPPSLHCEMTLAAIENGKHILCEKPMAMNVAEAEAMTAAAAGTGRLALIDHELRFQPGRVKAREMIRDGAVGAIRHVKTLFRSPHRGDPSVAFNWWSDIKQGGGALGAINSHVIDSLHWMLDTQIASVACQLHTNVRSRPAADGEMREVTSDDEANMLLRFAGGEVSDDATGLVSVSLVEGPDYMHRMEFHGEDGVLRVEHDGKLFVSRRGEAEWSEITVKSPRSPGAADTGFASAFYIFAGLIVTAIRDNAETANGAATFADGVAVQRILDASRVSDREGRTVPC